MLSHARRIAIAMNGEAWAALYDQRVKAARFVSGLQEDFGEGVAAGGPRANFPRLVQVGDCGLRITQNARRCTAGDDAPGSSIWPRAAGRARKRAGFDHLLGDCRCQWIAAAAFSVAVISATASRCRCWPLKRRASCAPRRHRGVR